MVAKASPRTKWSIHNLVAHPIGEICYLITGREQFGNWIHDLTIPPHPTGEGRG